MSLRSLRACLVCSIVQTGSKFNSEGCPNCEDFLEMRGSSEAVQDCTSQVFEGMMTLNNTNSKPEAQGQGRGSWVAKWQRLEGYVPGVYAVKVVGALTDDYIAAAENAGVKYIPRDGSEQDDA